MEFTGERFVPIASLMDDEIAFEHFHRYYAVQNLVSGKTVLDIASGEGFGSAILASVASHVVGIDIDPECISHAEKTYGSAPNLIFRAGNATAIPLENNAVEIVVSFETIEHLSVDDQQQFIAEVKRVLKPGGLLFISTPDRQEYSDRHQYSNEFHQHEYTRPEFETFLSSVFKNVQVYLQGYEIVSAITTADPLAVEKVSICDWPRDKSRPFSRKYMIAACSDSELNTDGLSSVVFQVNKDYVELTDRLLQKEKEIVELGEWGHRLDREAVEKNLIIQAQQREIGGASDLPEWSSRADYFHFDLVDKLRAIRSVLDNNTNNNLQVAELNSLLRLRDQELLNAERAESHLKMQLASTSEQLRLSEHELSEKNEKISSLEAQQSENQDELARVTTQREQSDEAYAGLSVEYATLVREHAELETEIGLLSEQKAAALIENDALNSKFAALLSEKSELVKTHEGLTERHTHLTAQKENLSSEHAFLSSRHTSLTEQYSLLLHEHERVSETNASLMDQHSESEDKIARLNKELAAARDRESVIAELKEKLHNQYSRTEKAESRLEEIYSSEGWRVLKMYYDLKGKILHEDSRRYRFTKKVVNFLRGKKEISYRTSLSDLPMKALPVQEVFVQDVEEFEPFELPLFESPEVTIIIPVFNGWSLTYKCLRSIKENTLGITYQVVLADDGSTDATVQAANLVTNLRVIRGTSNVGFLLNCNNAASQTETPFLHFLNNDTQVKPYWLSSLVELVKSDTSIGMAGSKLIYPDGRMQEAGGIIWNDSSGWNFGHKDDPEAPQFNYVKEVDYVSGASILVRRDLWLQLGGFDERYAPAYYEDTDLAFSVREMGYKVMFQPMSEVIHFEGSSHGENSQRLQKINRDKFQAKWSEVLKAGQFANADHVFWARDRSRSRKTILVIDHYVPHYDKDAGSRAIFKLLDLLTEMDYNVKFIGDNFYKHEPYTTVLQQMGVEVLYGNWFAQNWMQWIIENGSYLDHVLLSRPHISVKYIDVIRQHTKASIAYYGHDLHFLRERRQYEIEKKPELLKSMKEWKELETTLIHKSDNAITLSYVEKEIMEQELGATNVKVLPVLFYKRFNDPITDFSSRKDLLFVGGFNHRPNVDAVLWFIREVWPIIAAANESINFIIVGSLVPDEIQVLQSSRILVKGYLSDSELDKLYSEICMAVIPLRYGAGMKGKSVEAFYRGVPVVTTTIGVEGFAGLDEIVPVTDDAADFAKNILSYYSDEQALIRLSKYEVSYAKQYFSKEVVQEVIAQTFP